MPTQKLHAKSLSPFIALCKEHGAKSIIDIGTGNLRNLVPTLSSFAKVWGVDTAIQCDTIKCEADKLKKKYKSFVGLLTEEQFYSSRLGASAAMTICVLHTIPEIEVRHRVLSAASSNLIGDGLMLVDVPSGENYYRKRLTESNKYLDGYVMGEGARHTFYKEFSSEELTSFVEQQGFHFHTRISVPKHLALVFSNGKVTR